MEQVLILEAEEQASAPQRRALETGGQQPLHDQVLHGGDQLPIPQPSEEEVCEQSLREQLRDARRRANTKTEHLRQLKLVRTYRHHEETRDLDQVTERWLKACQDSLRDYYLKVKETAVGDTTKEDVAFSDFIEKIGIDKELVKYDVVSDDFVN